MRRSPLLIVLALSLAACSPEPPVAPDEPAPTAATIEVEPAQPTPTAVAAEPAPSAASQDCEAAICAGLEPLPDDVKVDGRPALQRPKVVKLLEVELSNIKRLLDATPLDDRDRPRLALRLAEGFAELAQSLEREGSPGARPAREQAISYYDIVLEGYPGWCQFPKSPPDRRVCPDELSYRKALAYERLGSRSEACATFRSVAESTELPRLRGLSCRGLLRSQQLP